ncbi:hypothetical protein MNV49_003347 [Pseudohyphozyma bogoriensis]|nr:hypothetical protein MNV49_003347 [Pseudohyphozyma bogoriensis]
MTRNRRPPSNVPQIPIEQVRFVGHPHAPDSDDTFTNEIAPLHAHLIKSVSFHPFGSTLADELLYARNFDDAFDAAYQKLQLSDLKALEISGEELGTLLCHFARMASPVTHVVLCERDELEYATLKTFLLAISPTLASLVIRQPGTFFEQQINAWEFTPTDLPNLKRLVVALEGEIAAPLARFAKLANVEVLEIGTDSPEFVKQIVRYVEDRSAWPALKELGIVCHGVDGEDWEALHVACGRRGVSLSPGFTFEADFPGGM